MNVPFCQVVNAGPLTSSENHDSSKKYRKSCNSCTKSKKKCDGGTPCMSCLKWKVECVYSERRRPGPVMKLSQEKCRLELLNISRSFLDQKSISSTSSIPMESNICGLFQDWTGKEVKYLKLFVKYANPNLSILTPDILRRGLVAIVWSAKQPDRYNVLKRRASKHNGCDFSACAALTWTCCGIGTIIAKCDTDNDSDRYLQLARESLQCCFDSPSQLVVKAMFAFEILVHISTASCNKSLLGNACGIYHSLGETMLSHLDSSAVDDTVLILTNLLRIWDFSLADKRCSRMQNILNSMNRFTIHEESEISLLPENLKVMTYSLNKFAKWQRYLASNDPLMSCSTKFEINHQEDIALDIKYLRFIIDSRSITRDPLSYAQIQISLSLHHLSMNNFHNALSCAYNSLDILADNLSLIWCPLTWMVGHLLLSIIYGINRCVPLVSVSGSSSDQATGFPFSPSSIVQCLSLGRFLVASKHRLGSFVLNSKKDSVSVVRNRSREIHKNSFVITKQLQSLQNHCTSFSSSKMTGLTLPLLSNVDTFSIDEFNEPISIDNFLIGSHKSGTEKKMTKTNSDVSNCSNNRYQEEALESIAQHLASLASIISSRKKVSCSTEDDIDILPSSSSYDNDDDVEDVKICRKRSGREGVAVINLPKKRKQTHGLKGEKFSSDEEVSSSDHDDSIQSTSVLSALSFDDIASVLQLNLRGFSFFHKFHESFGSSHASFVSSRSAEKGWEIINDIEFDHLQVGLSLGSNSNSMMDDYMDEMVESLRDRNFADFRVFEELGRAYVSSFDASGLPSSSTSNASAQHRKEFSSSLHMDDPSWFKYEEWVDIVLAESLDNISSFG